MEQIAVEWLMGEIFKQKLNPHYENLLEQAKQMEAKQKIEHQLFIGKVTCIIGFDKTLELLKESKLKKL